MKRKGFTLIELLAVIVIIAIIAVITIPLISKIIEDAKKNSTKDSAYAYLNSVNNYILKEVIQNKEFNLNGDYFINNDGNLENLSNINYKAYKTGYSPDVIYYDPIKNKKCSEYDSSNITGKGTNYSGCMKWFVIKNSSEKNNSVDVILNHSLTSDYNFKYANEFLNSLTTTYSWKITPRFITADEIANIVGADSKDAISFKSNKIYVMTDSMTSSEKRKINKDTHCSYFYLDGKIPKNSKDPYNTDYVGWQYFGLKQVGNTVYGNYPSTYSWLYNYLTICGMNYCSRIGNEGILKGQENTSSYWTSSPINLESVNGHWIMDNLSRLDSNSDTSYSSVRPVITIPKNKL